MMTKGSGAGIVGGSGDGVASSTIIGGSSGTGFSSVFAVPGTSSGHATVTNNNNILDMDGFLGLARGPSSAIIGDSISPLRPQLQDMELRRRARNNSILAKLQELEANACVQAARSERLRMMREEYESLVRRYASGGSSRKSHWATPSNGYLNENNNNGFPPTRYLQPFNIPQQHHQQPYISVKEPSPQPMQPLQPLLLSTATTTTTSTTNAHPFSSSAHPTRDIPSKINPSFATTGVNTDITGPVKPIDPSEHDKEDDLQRGWERRKVTSINIDSGSQTETATAVQVKESQQMGYLVEVDKTTVITTEAQQQPQARETVLLPASSSSAATAHLDHRTRADQGAIVQAGVDEKAALPLLKQGKNVPTKVEMMLMELDEDDDDDESSYQAARRRKQQLEKFHQQLEQPAARDDTNSISSAPSTPAAKVGNNATEEVGFKQDLRLKQLEKVGAVGNEKVRQLYQTKPSGEDETSQDTTTLSLARDRKVADKRVLPDEGDLSRKISFYDDEISLSESTSGFHAQRKKQSERKKLLDRLVTQSSRNNHSQVSDSTGNGIDEGGRGASGNQENPLNYDSSEDGEPMAEGKKRQDAEVCSSPIAGATSESIGDSVMDSIHKTPDALLPQDDTSELHEIEEVRIKEHVVTATAASTDLKTPKSSGVSGGAGRSSKPFRVQPGVNDKVSVEKKMRLKQEPTPSTTSAFQEVEKDLKIREQAQINDAKEIRSNNLSSSKVDVPAEGEENFTHANNPSETNTGITTTSAPTTVQKGALPILQKDLFEKKDNDEKSSGEAAGFYEDVEHSMDKELIGRKNPELVDSQFTGTQIVSGDSGSGNKSATLQLNESDEKKTAAGMILHSPAPSANMSAPSSSTTSSFTSGSNALVNGGTNDASFPPSNPPVSVSANLPQRDCSSGSSSTSSSRQHSLDDQGDGNAVGVSGNDHNTLQQQIKEHSNLGSYPHHGSPQVKQTIQQQPFPAPTLPQSVHKRHQQLQEEQVRKLSEEKETTLPPVGADVMPERLSASSSSDSFSVAAKQSGAVLEAAATPTFATTANNVVPVAINNGTKASPPEKGAGSGKTTRMSSSSPAKKIGSGNNVSNSNGSSGVSGGLRAQSKSSKGSTSGMKQGQSGGSAVTVPSGPTGAQNTALRVRRPGRLKLHEDSDTDSSEIGSGRNPSGGGVLSKGNTSSEQQRQGNGGSSQNKGEVKKSNVEKMNTEVDDDFDDFYDNF